MEFREYIDLLRRNWWLIVVGAVAGVAVAFALNAAVVPQYRSAVQLLLTAQVNEDATSSEVGQANTVAQQQIPSYLLLARSARVLDMVIADLDLTLSAGQLAGQVTTSSPVNTRVIDIAVVSGSAQTAADVANSIAKNFTEVAEDVSGQAQAATIEVDTLQTAEPAGAINAGKRTSDLLTGLLVGAALGFAAAAVRRVLDRRVHSVRAVRQLTSVPIVATLPKPTKASSGYRLRPSEDEGIRKIQAFLDSREGDTGVVAIVPTTSSDEGALVGSRLAISSARSGEPVILIDANLHGPGAASVLGLKGSPGLLDAVERRTPLDEVVQQRGDNGPFFVPAGPDDGRSYADFPAGSLKAFVHDIEPRSRRVLLIGSRVDTGADGVVVLGAVSGALLVVVLGRTTRDAIESSLEAIRMVGKPTLGIVLISNQRA